MVAVGPLFYKYFEPCLLILATESFEFYFPGWRLEPTDAMALVGKLHFESLVCKLTDFPEASF